MSVAAIGDLTLISGLRLVGVAGFEADSGEEARKILEKLIDEAAYRMIILPERFIEPTQEIRSKLIKEKEVTPIFAFIPDYTKIKGERIKELKRNISMAVGSELKL